jgi:acyl carrier protein
VSEETAERLRGIISRALGIPLPNTDTDLVETGVLDSLAFVELLVAVEEEFQIRFAPEELDIERFRSVGALVELVESHGSTAA